MKVFYLSTHNTRFDVAGKHKYKSYDEVMVAYRQMVKLPMRHMYYTVSDGPDRIILDSRVNTEINHG